MRLNIKTAVIVGCLLALTGWSYSGVIFRGEQFGYRDAAHFYYPLYRVVQREWEAGRWPLWEPEENAGMPLLGNPTAAVLYPGKVIYAVLPYAWAARAYVVAHTLLAFAGMFALMRRWGTSASGSALSALAYAFGAPVLFQYCNIIFLVGAAWIPWGFRAVDGWLRLGRRASLLELAAVLALQTLGGDPEASYVTGLCAAGYAVGLASAREARPLWPSRAWPTVLVVVVSLVGWVAVVLAMGGLLPTFRPVFKTPLPLPWMRWVSPIVAGAWACAGVALAVDWLGPRRRPVLVPMLGGLLGAAVLAAALTSAQLLPVLEFTGQSVRAASGGAPHDIYPFSLEPARLAEFVWPNVFGSPFHGSRSWLEALPPVGDRPKQWVPSIYVGGLTILLALTTLGVRGGPPWRAWLSAVAVISLLASLGEYTSPLWWARFSPTACASLGGHDPLDVPALRFDGKLRDGDGSLYWAMATALPGFRQFRFPSKLLSFTTLALAGLAGMGWDRLLAGRSRRAAATAAAFLALSLIALVAVTVWHERIVTSFRALPTAKVLTPFGPFDAEGAFGELRTSLVHGAVVFAIALGLVLRGARRPVLAGALALAVLTVDLGLANTRYIFTVPQRLLDEPSWAAAQIEAAEREDPSPLPYRVHRMPLWNPMSWFQRPSADRVADFVRWERRTLQPKYGITEGIEYTHTLGVTELYDYDWFFGGFYRKVDADTARRFQAKPGQEFVVYPRRAFDMWNTRYFILPVHPAGWREEQRGFAAFLDDTDTVYPRREQLDGPDAAEARRRWIDEEDVQILRNRNCYPRAWLVHHARAIRPLEGLDRTDREGPMLEMLFENDHLWYDPNLTPHDPRKVVWVDLDKANELSPYVSAGRPYPPSEKESVSIISHGPQRVELEAVLERPGMVVLADVYYPGWRLTIDGRDAPVYRANRMMRGAAVPSGTHRLVYTYEPRSFRVGGRISLAALLTASVLGLVCLRRPVSPNLAGPTPPGASGRGELEWLDGSPPGTALVK